MTMQQGDAVAAARDKLAADLKAGINTERSRYALANTITSSFQGTDKHKWAAMFVTTILPAGKPVKPLSMEFVDQLVDILRGNVVSRPPEDRDWIFDGLVLVEKMTRI